MDVILSFLLGSVSIKKSGGSSSWGPQINTKIRFTLHNKTPLAMIIFVCKLITLSQSEELRTNRAALFYAS